MRTVVSELCVGKYVVLSLDGPVPSTEHKKYRIDNLEYDIVPLYDMPNSIGIAGSGSFVGKKVHFV